MEGFLPVLETPASPPWAIPLELHRVEGTNGDSSAGSDSIRFDSTESIVSLDVISESTRQTEATTVGDDVDVDAAHSRDPVLGCDKQGQDMYDLHQRISPYEGLANIAPVIHFTGPPFGDGEVVDSPPGFTRVGTHRDQLPDKLEQRVGPARHHYQLGICDATPEPVALQVNGIHPNLGQVNALWRHPEESNSEVREVIEEVKRLDLLPAPTPSSHPQEINTPPHDTEVAFGPFTATSGWLVPVAHSGTTGDKPPPTEADWNAFPSPLSAARQARLNLTNGEILRLMPRGRSIHFDVDTASFLDANIPPWAVKCIKNAARKVADVYNRQNLGITFAYTEGPGRKVFSIRYGRTLPEGILAQSFFPCDAPEDRQVRISPLAMHRAYGGSGHSRYMRIILAHEFMHILGFRHWHAGSDAVEMQLASFLWPGTVDGDWNSIMYTPLYSRMGFSEEDFRVIKEVYSEANRSVVGGCLVVDVDPFDGSYVL